MALLPRLLIGAARLIASNPRVRAKAADILENQVRPRAAEAWRKTKPRIDAAKAGLRDAAAEADPLKDPRGFAARLKGRIFPRSKRH